MKLKLSLVMPGDDLRDITLSFDVTATVADAARALILAGLSGNRQLERAVGDSLAPVTLRGLSEVSAAPVLFDPETQLSEAGIQSGWIIEAAPEFDARRGWLGGAQRIVDIVGHIEVLNGRQKGTQFSLIAGRNLVGRDRACRIHLVDPSVSRRHAAIDLVTSTGVFTGNARPRAGLRLVMRDLGSANRIQVDGEVVAERVILNPCNVTLGDTELRVTPTFALRSVGGGTARLPSRALHMRSPRLAPYFAASSKTLPQPPSPSPPGRVPMLAMLAPVMLGVAMFAITRSPMSLVMVAFSPLMMIGSWLDNKYGGARKLRRELREFEKTLQLEREELRLRRSREIEVRSAEAPTLTEISSAIVARSDLLWARRPEHSSFLEIRFGDGTRPSRTLLKLPELGESAPDAWRALKRVEAEFLEISPVPVLDNLTSAGAIGVAGEPVSSDGIMRAIVMQLAGLHSPTELTLACFANAGQAETWAWLKWLPHVDAASSPLAGPQLAHDALSSGRLMNEIEGLLAARRGNRSADSQSAPVLIVLVLDATQIETSRLIALAEAAPSLGVHVIWSSRSVALLPAACRTFVETSERGACVNFVRDHTTVALHRAEFVDQVTAHRLARQLAPVEDAGSRTLDESDLPKSVDLRELSDIDLLGGGAEILRSWQSTDSLASGWQSGCDREATALSTVVGQGVDGPVRLDLRAQGPHALVGGTTGSGKSEFLQTWVMGLAAQISPERINFLLIDYKGGAAFAECTELPHTVGLVTDLTPHLVRRALASLRAELRYRENLLASHAAKDVMSMESRSDPATPPALVVVIDEFAALATDVPEFVDGVIDIAQRGRSLGLHLIMATQRPAGVINDNLRANTNLRVALRMADESESSDIIGFTDAALFEPQTPGRGAVKTGPGKIQHFQTGYLGGRAVGEPRGSSIEVCSFDFTEGDAWGQAVSRAESSTESVRQSRDIERLRDGILEAFQRARLAEPRRPWLDQLPEAIDLRQLNHADARGTGGILLGMRDFPAEQLQLPLSIDLDEVGSVGIFGASGTGKTTAILTLAASLCMKAETSPVHIYAIDAGGGALDALTPLPTVGAVAQLADSELCGRVLKRLVDVITERGLRFAAARVTGLAEYQRVPGAVLEPRTVLLLDGFGAFRQAHEAAAGPDSPMQLLSEIMMKGRAVGVHVVLTSDRAAAIPSSMASSLQQRYIFRLAGQQEYGWFGVSADVLEGAPPGRALLVGDSTEVQFALIAGHREFAAQASVIEEIGAELGARGIAPAVKVSNAPDRVRLDDLPVDSRERPVIGIDTRTFEAVSMPVHGLGVITGPAGSGRSTALQSCVRALERWVDQRGGHLDRVLLTLNHDEIRAGEHWDDIAVGESQVREAAQQLASALKGNPNSDSGKRFVVQGDGSPGVIVVEHSADAEGLDTLQALALLAKAARQSEVLVLFEFEQGGASGAWELFNALKRPSWGVALQPDERDGQTLFREDFGRVRYSDFPSGRGFAVEKGTVVPVQIALPGISAETRKFADRLRAA